MDSKSPVKQVEKTDIQQSHLVCCACAAHALRSAVVRACLLSAILVCFLGGVIFLVCGGVYGVLVGLFLSGAVCILFGVVLLVIYVWFTRRTDATSRPTQAKDATNGQISTIGSPEYYAQVPPGQRSDYPMGPLLIMTLPRPKKERPRRMSRDSVNTTSSATSTPDYLGRRHPLQNKKNIPPLASAETLSPSLRSSYASIDSVV